MPSLCSLGARNDVRCLSIEHKLGIHASPTCVLAFGEKHGALGDLVGEPGRGLEYMFVMMNSARLSVGSERSEEHTSELQSPCNLVCRLLLEKKNKKNSPIDSIRILQ